MASVDPPKFLPDSEPLTGSTDYAQELVMGLNRLLDIALSEADQARRHGCLLSAPDVKTLAREVDSRRRHLQHSFGMVDERLPIDALHYVATTSIPAKIAEGDGYDVYTISWPVFPGVDGEGLLLEPKSPPHASIIAVPDADQTPEDLVGLTQTVSPSGQFARHFAQAGCRVIVPALIDRNCTWSGNPAIRMTNQPHREFIYRMAYQMGRHIIGYEGQKLLSLVDYLTSPEGKAGRVGIFGYGEGGLLSLVVGAFDPRIGAVGVSGYFRRRYEVWQEPIYRNVWKLLDGLTDAELASMIAPRSLIIEASTFPEVAGPPTPSPERRGAAPGAITTPPLEEVRAEVALARSSYTLLGADAHLVLIEPEGSSSSMPFGTATARRSFLEALDVRPASDDGSPPKSLYPPPNPSERQKRQFVQLCDYTQRLWHQSATRRVAFWARADASSLESWTQSTAEYRTYFSREVIGEYPVPTSPLAPKSRLIESTPEYEVYEVVIELWHGIPSFGYLLLPLGVVDGHPRPAVVCQHGLGGDPARVIDADSPYHGLGRELASRGYVVYVPQAPFVGPMGDDFRVLQRKANPLGLSLFSFIVAQHQRILQWLGSLSFVDPERIGLYGLSYGGKTAMRVPAIVPGYAVSICSGDFNEWIMKNVSTDFFSSYMFTGEYEMFEFDLGHTFNYAEMAYLIAPRPFMVERGHTDACSTDEWVAFEYAKVRRQYMRLGVPEKTEIEFFDGGHEIHGKGTFAFLDRHLKQ